MVKIAPSLPVHRAKPHRSSHTPHPHALIDRSNPLRFSLRSISLRLARLPSHFAPPPLCRLHPSPCLRTLAPPLAARQGYAYRLAPGCAAVQARCFCPSGERLPSFCALARPCLCSAPGLSFATAAGVAAPSLRGGFVRRSASVGRRFILLRSATGVSAAIWLGKQCLRRCGEWRDGPVLSCRWVGVLSCLGRFEYAFCLVYGHVFCRSHCGLFFAIIGVYLLYRPSAWAFPWGCFVSSLFPVVCGFSGSRSLSPRWLPLAGRLVRGAVAEDFAVSVGCCVGADSLVLSAALLGGVAGRLSVLAAFGPGGAGALSSSSVSLVESCAAAGAAVCWWCGGGASVPVAGRLASRSLALVRFCAGSAGLAGGAPFVSLVGAPCPAGLVPSRRPFAGSGSGSWASAAAAAFAGCALSVFWCGTGAPLLPAWPGGVWSPVAAGWLAGAWSWSPVAAQPSLF